MYIINIIIHISSNFVLLLDFLLAISSDVHFLLLLEFEFCLLVLFQSDITQYNVNTCIA
jgi:hypothetical protein